MHTEVDRIVLKAVQHFAPFPDASLPLVIIFNFLGLRNNSAKINQFDFELDSIGRNLIVCLYSDRSCDGVVCVESSDVVCKVNSQGGLVYY